MAGYCGYSKSNNAIAAERDGLMTAGRLAKRLAGDHPRLRGLTAADVAETLRPCEWHHVSSWYTATDYYSPYVCTRDRARLYIRLVRRRREAVAGPAVYTGCTARWLEWGGTRRHPHADECSATDVTATITPGSAFVVLNGKQIPGGTMRKKKTTRGFELIGTDGRRLV